MIFIEIWLVIDNRCTIRQCADNLMISKSSVCWCIHNVLPDVDPDMYSEVKAVLNYNSKYRRMARKYWKR